MIAISHVLKYEDTKGSSESNRQHFKVELVDKIINTIEDKVSKDERDDANSTSEPSDSQNAI